MQVRRRMKSPERRAQVVQVALDLVARRGVQGTTLALIAAAAGVTPAALYGHFANKREIMVAGLDVLFEKIRAIHQSSSNPNALERIREIGVRHSQLLASEKDGFVFPLFEFMAAPPEEDLREELRVRHLESMGQVAEMAKEGQAQGTIAAEVDPYQVAWLMVARAWTEDVAALIGVADEWTETRSNQLLDLILGSIAAKDNSPIPDDAARSGEPGKAASAGPNRADQVLPVENVR